MQSMQTHKPTVLDYWKELSATPSPSFKGLQIAIILITWELWKERDARVFNNTFAMPYTLFQGIKCESKN